MYVILSQDVPQLGQKNGLVSVKRGYFANFLQPRGLAQIATADMIERLKESIIAAQETAAEAAQTMGKKVLSLKGVQVVFERKASDKGTLFKGIAEKDVAKAIMKEHGIEVAPEGILMNHIKKLGEHAIQVQIGDDAVEMKVVVNEKEG